MRSVFLGLVASLALFGVSHAQGAPDGGQIFQQRCKGCHDPAIERAPSKEALAQRPQSDIIHALTDGPMKPMASGLSAEEIKAVAAYLSPGGAAAPAPAANAGQGARRDVELPQVAVKTGKIGQDLMCKAHPPIKAMAGDWSSTGIDDRASRFQRTPGLSAADVPKLKVKWAYSMTGGGQASVVGDWLFITNRSGHFYAMDAKTGCVHWVVEGLVARTTPIVFKSPISPSGWAVIVGQSDRFVKAFDAQTGKPIWTSAKLEDHGSSVLTGSPVIAGDRLLVPISSIEEATSMSKAYACCTFRGSLAALDIKTGKTLWKTHTISEPRKTVREKADGQKVTGPAGAAVWAAPSIDKKRGLVYIVTGDSYTDVDTKGADAVMAIEIATGKIRWQNQVTERDNFVMGCGPNSQTGNCPTPMGPDHDFGATPILMTLKNGKQVLVAGQKSAYLWGFDPDTGKVLWSTRLGQGGALGGIEWGIGADDTRVYAPVSDLGGLMGEMAGRTANPPANPGLNAVDPATGKVIWSTPAPKAACTYAADKGKPSRCARAQSAAPAVIPGVVFEGALDGWFRAYEAATGKIVWEHSTTAQTYDTLNGIKGQPGGGIDGMGPTVAHGMVYVVSGNNGAARVGSNGVNVLLAYSVDGK